MPGTSIRKTLAALLFVCIAGTASAQNIVRIGVAQIAQGIGNPYRGVSLPAVLAVQGVFDTVTALDDAGNPIPALAVEWRQESPTTWIFKLRDGVKFSNGEALTADALVTSAAYMNTPQGKSETIGSTLFQVASAEAIDPLTVRVNLRAPDVLFPLRASIWRIPPRRSGNRSIRQPRPIRPSDRGRSCSIANPTAKSLCAPTKIPGAPRK